MERESLNIVFTGKEQVEVRRQPVPDLEPDQILVESSCTLISTGTESICYSRNFEADTHWARWVKYPFYPGYSNAGRVRAVGEAVTPFAEGDRVAARAPHCQYAAVSAHRAIKIPDGISSEEATWFGLANIVQNGVRRAAHELGDTVVVIGLGLLGQLVTQYMRLSGASEIIAIDLAAPRLEMARQSGATQTLAMGVESAVEAVADLTGGRMADVVYDVTGHAAVFAHALPLVRRFGKLLLLGDTGSPSQQCLTPDVIRRGVHIIGAHDSNPPPVSSDYAYWSHDKMAALFFTYLQRQQMNVTDLLTHRYPAQDAPEVYPMLQRDRSSVMGVLFDWEQID